MESTMKPTSDWRSLLKIHPAADLFPMMGEDELKALGEDIKANGLKTSIETWLGETEQECLIDGRNRLDAMAAVGFRFLKGGTPEEAPEYLVIYEPPSGSKKIFAALALRPHGGDPYALAISFNILRRHLTAEQKRELIGKLLKADPTKSDRAIAETAKTSHVTVAAKRAKMEATGQIDQSDNRVGADGKTRRQPTKTAATSSIDPTDVPDINPIAVDEAQAEEQPPAGHTSNRPLVEIKVLARAEWQTRALENEPTNAEEAELRYNAIGWETGAIEQRYFELKTAEGKALEDAKRFFPRGKGWKAWLKSQKTCAGTSSAMRLALYRVGCKSDGQPENTLTKFDRLATEIIRSEDDHRWSQLEAAVKRLIEEHTLPQADAAQADAAE